MGVDLLYLTWNRKRFTEISFGTVLANTAWELVEHFCWYDDHSEDGAWEWMHEHITEIPDHVEVTMTLAQEWRSPPKVMNDYVAQAESDYFAKIDSDIAVPPGWLEALVQTAERHPWVDLLGMEAGMTRTPSEGFSGPYGYKPVDHIGGVGLMRTEFFKTHSPIPTFGRFGFTEFQDVEDPVRGWIEPDLLVPQLDRIPVEPFVTLSAEYEAKKWQRHWERMDSTWCAPYFEWLLDRVPA